MALLEPNTNPTLREARHFVGLLFPGFLLLVGAVVFWRTDSLRATVAIAGIALAIAAAGLLAPRLARAIYLVWMYALYPIGWTVSHAVMAVSFYLVLTPIGLAMLLVRRDALRRKRNRYAKTYWIPSEPDDAVRHYVRQF